MTTVNMSDINQIETKAPSSTKVKVPRCPMNEPPKTRHIQQPVEQTFNDHFNGLVPDELKGGLKNMLLYGMSMPMKQHKRKKMLINLHSSKYTQQYLSKYLHVDMLSGLDDHSKMALVYGMNFLDAWMSNDPVPHQMPEQPKEEPPKDEQNI